MSDKSSTHLERTASTKRSEVVSEATVVELNSISPTVKALQLKLKNDEFSFKAGQWVDFIIPSLDTVGGFSMCSSPVLLQNSRLMNLAVKYSTHPPALWVSNECQVGDKVIVKSGGECVWDSQNGDHLKNILLIAGGIGINPIFSILQHIADVRCTDPVAEHRPGKTILLYSASQEDELIFKDTLDQLVNNDKFLSCEYFITKGNCKESSNVKGRRINEADVATAVKSLNNSNGMHSYICGPPPMIQYMQSLLRDNGLVDSQIHFEKWW